LGINGNDLWADNKGPVTASPSSKLTSPERFLVTAVDTLMEGDIIRDPTDGNADRDGRHGCGNESADNGL